MSSLLRSSNAIVRPLSGSLSARLPIVTRTFSQSAIVRGGGLQLDPPTGDLFGRKKGEKKEREGWEFIWWFGYCGAFVVAGIAYAFKPDTRFVLFSLWGCGIGEDAGGRMDSGKSDNRMWLTSVQHSNLGPRGGTPTAGS